MKNANFSIALRPSTSVFASSFVTVLGAGANRSLPVVSSRSLGKASLVMPISTL